ncbi:L-rhamnose-H+ transport protein [Pseudarcicella hirudinis]|uniref:L-rhamnose-H+ transport protein n=1 Tax=Pseudarcicella hirudinis TaxID=1079859 RepID=A0A1I5XWW4_9BACT|nr:L-rhamnose/proton symporter RhaT [Pseudarcicella hirudinis]SFQ36438.1 L-rhamnose-H+ transport protein [Pseudarcicella hirudinis]
MQVLFGVIYHFIGGFASGSFYIPFKKVKDWSWESYWIVGGIFSWLIVPFVAAFLTIPDFMEIIKATDTSILFWTYILGVLWGIGGLTFGLSMRYLGMSLGMSIVLGFCSAFGALIPPIYRDFFGDGTKGTFSGMLQTSGGQVVLLGVAVCLLGIFLCGKAGTMKEGDLSEEEKTASIAEFDLWKGLAVAITSGVLSACFNFGIEAGKSMAVVAVEKGCNPLFQNNVIFIVILWGGLTTNFIWCMILNTRNKTFGDYTNKKAPLKSNYLFSAIAGTTWFLQFFFYGMGESKLGNGASSWILHMACIIIISNLWGIYFNEWKGVSAKTFRTIIFGIIVVILSVFIVGYGNYLSTGSL